MLLRVLRVEQTHDGTTPADARCVVLVSVELLDERFGGIRVGITDRAKVVMRFGVESEDIAGGNLHHIHRAEQIPSLALVAVFLGCSPGFEGDFIIPRVALARKPEKIRHIAVCDKLLRTI